MIILFLIEEEEVSLHTLKIVAVNAGGLATDTTLMTTINILIAKTNDRSTGHLAKKKARAE